jgi:hypothetical protein
MFWVPEVSGELLVIVGKRPVLGAIVRLNVVGPAAPVVLVTRTPKVNVPLCDGVPLRTPVLLKESPGGGLPDATDQVIGNRPVAKKV